MISVSIFINGKPIFTRSAVNVTPQPLPPGDEKHLYKVDDGSFIRHQRNKGAVALAIQMLKTIKEWK